jgi:hypothetical protein
MVLITHNTPRSTAIMTAKVFLHPILFRIVERFSATHAIPRAMEVLIKAHIAYVHVLRGVVLFTSKTSG